MLTQGRSTLCARPSGRAALALGPALVLRSPLLLPFRLLPLPQTPTYAFDPLPDIPADFGPELPDVGVEGFLRVRAARTRQSALGGGLCSIKRTCPCSVFGWGRCV